MRPCLVFVLLLGLLLAADGLLLRHRQARAAQDLAALEVRRIAVAALGLTDLCLATEARYTRHPAASDPMAPFMDHPGAIEHFPSGSFWAPPGGLPR